MEVNSRAIVYKIYSVDADVPPLVPTVLHRPGSTQTHNTYWSSMSISDPAQLPMLCDQKHALDNSLGSYSSFDSRHRKSILHPFHLEELFK